MELTQSKKAPLSVDISPRFCAPKVDFFPQYTNLFIPELTHIKDLTLHINSDDPSCLVDLIRSPMPTLEYCNFYINNFSSFPNLIFLKLTNWRNGRMTFEALAKGIKQLSLLQMLSLSHVFTYTHVSNNVMGSIADDSIDLPCLQNLIFHGRALECARFLTALQLETLNRSALHLEAEIEAPVHVEDIILVVSSAAPYISGKRTGVIVVKLAFDQTIWGVHITLWNEEEYIHGHGITISLNGVWGVDFESLFTVIYPKLRIIPNLTMTLLGIRSYRTSEFINTLAAGVTIEWVDEEEEEEEL
ncbi:hypothetical protein HETIRDRAFT_426104 [Heterobasidion irregulare TC 32-1]|uniref:Uncharacterized protein n=1 Tax=Heterobasidion irregulare (strain TC 32-1) TaxID=747525 RepID=W4JRB0_HETIT|nr:uncharacterized protein HETIRDRAFT_426104 [Heterobasidion irregulare TC 32-1]XP_009553021.1 uncharacterized protein HETIRDRAFT_430904 [Heterobasidion irregulare TC 32-1]ETW75625.1 hypothetical protein HETIRDRAFT_430904 [Heterobasidion irregulare TC 32-1]ETW82387.1 hypothetical protein HETIRDRAFT_426104 [Heterobasidion irregulare TC 32-1]